LTTKKGSLETLDQKKKKGEKKARPALSKKGGEERGRGFCLKRLWKISNPYFSVMAEEGGSGKKTGAISSGRNGVKGKGWQRPKGSNFFVFQKKGGGTGTTPIPFIRRKKKIFLTVNRLSFPSDEGGKKRGVATFQWN